MEQYFIDEIMNGIIDEESKGVKSYDIRRTKVIYEVCKG